MKILFLQQVAFCVPLTVVALMGQVSLVLAMEDTLWGNASGRELMAQSEEDNFAILESIILTDNGIILIVDGQEMGASLNLDTDKNRLFVVLQGTKLATSIPIKEEVTEPMAGLLKRRLRIKQLERGLVEVSLNAPAEAWAMSSHSQGLFVGSTAIAEADLEAIAEIPEVVEPISMDDDSSTPAGTSSSWPTTDVVEAESPQDEVISRNTDPARLRDDLRVDPVQIVTRPQTVYAPGTSAGIPSAFGASWGDFYIAAAAATADNVRNEVDGGIAAGFGLGDSRKFLGLEFNYNNLSIRDFGANGSFDAKVHRIVYASSDTQIAAAVGWNNFTNYGSDPAGTSSSVYGMVNAYHFLSDNPDNRLPINLSLGVGGAPFYAKSDVGVIAGAGMQVHPNIGVSAAWSGLGFNLAASYLPVRTLPLTLNVIYGDVFNNTDGGSVLAIGVSYGFDFTPNF
ncbi:MAG: hypothetical protein VKJ27_07515 [Synechocystis sp.]|nr:hypothetical protein [Synechocystis sp.]